MLPRNLDLVEVRVLGALVEKELSTPDHYPLSLNALVSACNQSSNREPVMALANNAVSHAIDMLRRRDLVRSFQGSGERVPKYQHLLATGDDVTRAELAVLCVLMLRGQQTLAEVRTRAARLLPDDDADAIEAALESLIARESEPPVIRLPRRAGQKEMRYAHLLSGTVISDTTMDDPEDHSLAPRSTADDRIEALETLTQALQGEIAELKNQLALFRQQFE